MAGVLVVDDDPTICALVCEFLAEGNHEVTCAQSDRDAYAALDTDASFDALVIDINLGEGTTGFDVARAARQTRPDLQVIYISGEAAPANHDLYGVPNSRFLQKPFAARDLLDLL